MKNKKQIYTIGHSTHTTREFINILKAYDIKCLVDVRHYPGSRYCPQFNKTNLKRNLKRHGMTYYHLIDLGGRRPVDKNSHLNDGWRSSAFRGFADYMQTETFKEGLQKLIEIASLDTTVMMCAEAVPWRCHRSLIADALLVQGLLVIDILNEKNAPLHELTPFAKMRGEEITYPSAQV